MALHVTVSPINLDVCAQVIINSIIAVIPHPIIPNVPIPNDTLLNELCPDGSSTFICAFADGAFAGVAILSLLLFYYLWIFTYDYLLIGFGNDILSRNGVNGKEIGVVPKNTINNIIDKNNSWRPIIKIKLDIEKSGTTSLITTMITILFYYLRST